MFEDWIKSIEKQQDLIDKHILDIASENSTAILDLNRSQMFDKGVVDVDNPGIQQQYSAFTKREKPKLARFPKISFVTLKWDGRFHASLFLKFGNNYFEIDSNDPIWVFKLKDDDRFKNALGLTDESLDKLIEEVFTPGLINNIRKGLGV